MHKEISDLKKKQLNEIEELTETKEVIIRELNDDIVSLKSTINTLNIFKGEKENIEKKIESLTAELKKEKEDRLDENIKKDKEKHDEIEKLRKDMIYKIKETKSTLLALNEEQLETTTKMTILQNHQLTSELEFQSKQTEKLVNQNKKLEEQLNIFKREKEINIRIENEMTKKNINLQKLVNTFKKKIEEYESKFQNHADLGKKLEFESESKKDELVALLEGSLEEAEKKLSAYMVDYENLKRDFDQLQKQYESIKNKHKYAALLLTDFLDDLISNSDKNISISQNIYLDLDRIKNTKIDDLEKDEKIALTLVLLKQLQPYLNENNLVSNNSGRMESNSIDYLLGNINVQKQFSFEDHSQSTKHLNNVGELPKINKIKNSVIPLKFDHKRFKMVTRADSVPKSKLKKLKGLI